MSAVNTLNSGVSLSGLYAVQTNQLSEATKAKLIALGIDPSTVSSEAEAQALISQVEAMSKTDKARPQTNGTQQTTSSEQELMQKARELAEKVGVSLSQNDTLDDMCKKISDKLEQLSAACVNDTAKMQVLKDYGQQLSDINSKYRTVQTTQEAIFAAMNMVSWNNQIALKLAK